MPKCASRPYPFLAHALPIFYISLPIDNNQPVYTLVALPTALFAILAAAEARTAAVFSSFRVQCSLHDDNGPTSLDSFISFLLYLITHHGWAGLRLFNGFSDYPSAHFIKSLCGGSNLATGYPSTYPISTFFTPMGLASLCAVQLIYYHQFLNLVRAIFVACKLLVNSKVGAVYSQI